MSVELSAFSHQRQLHPPLVQKGDVAGGRPCAVLFLLKLWQLKQQQRRGAGGGRESEEDILDWVGGLKSWWVA